MIQPHELRIGNYVLLNGRVIQITNLDEFRQVKAEPIPITEDELIKLGFKKDTDNCLTKDNVSLFLDNRFKTNLFLQDQNFKWFGVNQKIKYIHQLQNLYFALTNKELTYKL